jgi:hypothetical protein
MAATAPPIVYVAMISTIAAATQALMSARDQEDQADTVASEHRVPLLLAFVRLAD